MTTAVPMVICFLVSHLRSKKRGASVIFGYLQRHAKKRYSKNLLKKSYLVESMDKTMTDSILDSLITTKEAGAELGIGASRVRQLIMAGRLPAVKSGRDLLIRKQDLVMVQDRPPGRPSAELKASLKNAPKVAESTAAYGAKESPAMAKVEAAYNKLAFYDAALASTAHHKSIHSTVHSKLSPVLHLLRQALKEEGKL